MEDPPALLCRVGMLPLVTIRLAALRRYMSTMNISLPESLKSFVDQQVRSRGYNSSSECVRELIRKDQDRLRLRGLLLEGAASPPAVTADAHYFAQLRDRDYQAGRR